MLSLHRVLWVILASLCLLLPVSAHAQEDFLDPEDAFALQVAASGAETIDVHFRVAPEYYMYRERFEFALLPDGAGTLGEPVFPMGLVKYDPTFEKDLEVYYGQVTIRVPVAQLPAGPFTLRIGSQGCADAGLCYPPAEHDIPLLASGGQLQVQGPYAAASVPAPVDATSKGAGASAGAPQGAAELLSMGDTGFAAYLASAGWWQVILLSAALGVLLSFTPCVLPMVPILLAILAGSQSGNAATPASRWRNVSLAAVFVLGMSLVYTALGVAAGLVGASLAAWLQVPWVLTLFAILLALLALAMFDVFTLQAPGAMQTRLNAFMEKLPGGRYGAVFLMGMVSALIVGPCVAAPLAGVLLFISQTGDVVLGGSALFAMAWGEGLLLLAVGASSGVLMPKAGGWMNGVKWFFGVLLLATAWWMMNSVLPDWVMVLGWTLLAAWSAVMLGAFERLPEGSGPGRMLLKGLGLLLAGWALVLLVGLAMGNRSLMAPLQGLGTGLSQQQAGAAPVAGIKEAFVKVNSSQEFDALLANADRPVMLDFYADWCVSCIEMERFTFTDPQVEQKMGQMLLVQADVTANTPAHRELLKRFKLFGPPGIIFFDAQGREMPEPRVVGFMNAANFSKELDRVLGSL